jgi:hypothetical protein
MSGNRVISLLNRAVTVAQSPTTLPPLSAYPLPMADQSTFPDRDPTGPDSDGVEARFARLENMLQ